MNMRNQVMKHPVQAKYLLILFLAILAPTVLLGTCLYILIFHLLAEQMAFPEAVFSNLVPVVKQLNMLLVVLLPILILLILWIGLIVSHRFGGPIERLEKELDRILAGDYNHKIKVRKNDDLKNIGNKINQLMDKMRPK